MDGTPQFFPYDIQDENDSRFQAIEGSSSTDRLIYQDGLASTPFAGHVSSLSAPYSAMPMQPPPRSMSSMPARASVQQGSVGYHLHPGISYQKGALGAPSVDPFRLETPGLSSASSTTPETRPPSQIITPPGTLVSASHSGKPPEAIFPPPSLPPPASLPTPKKRRPRKPRVKPERTAEEEQRKRNKFLERNRVAATKCRQKKKNWMGDLEETKLELENRNAGLRMECSTLLHEVSQARALLMTHANCHDPNINKWIDNEAKRFVLGAGERYDTMLANFGFGSRPTQRQESISSVSAYTTGASNDVLSPTSRHASISIPRGLNNLEASTFFQAQIRDDGSGSQLMMTNEPSFSMSSTNDLGAVSHLGRFDISNDNM